MKKILILMLLVASMSLFATLNIEIDFDQDVVGETGTEPFVSPYFNITNEGAAAEFTIDIEMLDYPTGWFLTWCHADPGNVGLSEGCHHHSQPWTFTLPASATLEVDFQVNNMANAEGMITFEYVITGGDLTAPIILPFSFRTVNFVSNDEDLASVNDLILNNYPNPFNPETTISYALNRGSQVKLEVFNILGQRVSTLVNEYRAAGNHTVVWNGKNEDGNSLASGIYLYKLTNDTNIKMNKMILLK